jgi:hypothetical protein
MRRNLSIAWGKILTSGGKFVEHIAVMIKWLQPIYPTRVGLLMGFISRRSIRQPCTLILVAGSHKLYLPHSLTINMVRNLFH